MEEKPEAGLKPGLFMGVGWMEELGRPASRSPATSLSSAWKHNYFSMDGRWQREEEIKTWLSELELNGEDAKYLSFLSSLKKKCPPTSCPAAAAVALACVQTCLWLTVKPHKRLFSALTCRLGGLGQIHLVVCNISSWGLF